VQAPRLALSSTVIEEGAATGVARKPHPDQIEERVSYRLDWSQLLAQSTALAC
jgi:hypothetical protein